MPNHARPRDPAATRQDILNAATIEFSDHGLTGARIGAIADRTRTTVRMIYYYFGSKEGLYRAVLDRAYTSIRETESALALDCLAPADAIRKLVEATFDYHQSNPGFVRLVIIENINRGIHLAGLEHIKALNASVLMTLGVVLARGQADGVFRADATAMGLHLLMTSFCFYRVANQHTLRTIFGQSPVDPVLTGPHRAMIADAVLGYLRK